MLYLVTGLPGAAKTLYSLCFVKRLAGANRPVFYSGIKELTLPWTEIDPLKWFEMPPNSIVVIDECQRIYRPRMHGAGTPKHVEEMETHRHLGIDVVLITQHPMLLDSNIRRLVNTHFHVVRTFGLQRSTVHEWQGCKENCDKSRSDSIVHKFVFPNDAFGWYKSAEVHTVKRRLPARLLLLPLAVALLAGVTWSIYNRFANPAAPDAVAAATSVPRAINSSSSSAASTGSKGRELTPEQYVVSYAARVPGLAYTAPVYDQVTAPVVAPYPAACVSSSGRCVCYSQQATVLPDVPSELCGRIVKHGFFVAWRVADSEPVVDRSPSKETLPGGSNASSGFVNIGSSGARGSIASPVAAPSVAPRS